MATMRRLLTVTITLLLLVSSGWAEEKYRKWSDSTGTFEVEAKLLKYANGKVELLKKDGRVIAVPETRLSAGDRKYLMGLAKSNPFAGGVPLKKPAARKERSAVPPTLVANAGEIQVLPVGGTAILLDQEQPPAAIAADPASAPAVFKAFNSELEKIDAYSRCSLPILIDPQTPTYAVSVHRAGQRSRPLQFGRIYLAGPGQAKGKVVLDNPETLLLLDHHLGSGRSLAAVGVNSPSERGGDLVLLDNLAQGQPKVLARWHMPGWDKPGFKPKIEFARLLDAQRAIIRLNSSIYVWDLIAGKALQKIDRANSRGLQVSGSRRYLALPASGGCRIVDLVEGKALGTVPFPGLLTPTVHFSPDGKKLGMTAGNQFAVWDLSQGRMAAQETINRPCGAFYGWVGDNYLLTQLAGLIDIKLGLAIWSYQLPGRQMTTSQGGFVAASTSGMASLGSMALPHASARAMAKRLQEDEGKLMCVLPGTAVSLKVQSSVAGVNTDEVRRIVAAAAQKAGWKIVDGSPIELVANISQGKKQELLFRRIGQSILGRPDRASIQPFSSSFVIRRGNDLLWSRKSINRIPSLLRLKPGETLQQAVKRYEKPEPDYFKYLRLPPRILKPQVSEQIGRSSLRKGVWQDYYPNKKRRDL